MRNLFLGGSLTRKATDGRVPNDSSAYNTVGGRGPFQALVIDSVAAHRRPVRDVLSKHGWEVWEAGSLEEAKEVFERRRPSLVFCDAHAKADGGQAGGLPLLCELRNRLGASAHIVITAASTAPGTPAEAILNGASDFMRQPYDEERIAECSGKVLGRLRASEREVFDAQLAARFAASEITPSVCELVGESNAMVNVFRELARILNIIQGDQHGGGHDAGDAGVPPPSFFLTGETGTGKELIARTIHKHSSQPEGPFIPVNCGALPEELAESELFGHAGGAFTGAGREKVGLWEAASGGTLFLDEITEAPPTVQPKLLRVLQDGRVRRLGSNRFVETNVQVVAASNRDMEAEVRAGRFRRDLYHRLSVHRLHLPPLRDRLEDVPLIVEHFSRRHFRRRVRFSQEALDALMAYSYPGNVRELENIVRGAARKSPDGVVYAVDLATYAEMIDSRAEPRRSELKSLTAEAEADVQPLSAAVSDEGLDEQVRCFRLRLVREALARCDNNITRAARVLKICRPTLYRLIKEMEVGGGPSGCSRAARVMVAGREGHEDDGYPAHDNY